MVVVVVVAADVERNESRRRPIWNAPKHTKPGGCGINCKTCASTAEAAKRGTRGRDGTGSKKISDGDGGRQEKRRIDGDRASCERKRKRENESAGGKWEVSGKWEDGELAHVGR